ncbi:MULTISPECIES: hypothetical protein [Nocardiaceae]|uniref:hypothetical protein n=1 Tax=Nocardiaceae TaxID=85025 RepID=UPI00050CC0E3|nr:MULTISPECIES: hypothetical protein [Rhodococcus]OZE29378.1 hypothetical protein CH278_21540 [Rhodococcus sp. 05-2254-5]OZE53486.1 hypothetical protein CH269_20090 [Rhodococcus sp. 05-2254-1]
MRAALYVFVGLMFGLYPVLRPYSDEMSSAGADAFASSSWVTAHTFAMLGFIALGLVVLYGGRRSDPAVVTTWIGVGLLLPYYGAETFALHALGIDAAANSNPGLLDLVDPIRYSIVQTVMFGLGLVSIAVGLVMFALRNRYAMVLAAGFVLYLPQFYTPPAVRIAHGILIVVGAIIAARAVAGSSVRPTQPISTITGA